MVKTILMIVIKIKLAMRAMKMVKIRMVVIRVVMETLLVKK